MEQKQIDIEAIKARHEVATPGPWERIDTPDYAEIRSEELGINDASIALVARADDAEFIAHAWEDISALLDVVERLAAELDKVRSMAILTMKGGFRK